MNEIECCNIWKLDAYTEDGKLNRENIKLAMKRMAETGIRDKVISHSKKVSFVLKEWEIITTQESKKLKRLKGS